MTKTKKKTRAKRMKPVKAWAGLCYYGAIRSWADFVLEFARYRTVSTHDSYYPGKDSRTISIAELPQKGRQQ